MCSSWLKWALFEEEMSCFWCVHWVSLLNIFLPLLLQVHSGLLRGPWTHRSRVHPTHNINQCVRVRPQRFLNRKFLRKKCLNGEKRENPSPFLFGLYSWFEERCSRSQWWGVCTERVEREKCRPRLADIPRGNSVRLDEASEANLSLAF